MSDKDPSPDGAATFEGHGIVEDNYFTHRYAAPEAVAERVRVSERSGLVSPLIVKRVDIAYDEEFLQRDSVIKTFATTTIQEDQLDEYVGILCETAKLIGRENEKIDPHTIQRLVRTTNTLDQAHLFRQMATVWQERFLANVNDDVAETRTQDFIDVLGMLPRHTTEVPESGTEEQQSFAALAHLYTDIYALPEDAVNQRLASEVKRLTRGNSNNAEKIGWVHKLFRSANGCQDRDLAIRFIEQMSKYSHVHSLTDDFVYGATEKILPAMERGDPQVAILSTLISSGVKEGSSDFLCHAYGLRVTPEHVNELLMAARETPTTQLGTLEQIRLDAKSVSMLGIRDYVHDQAPNVHDVITAMVHYYDTREERYKHEIEDKVPEKYKLTLANMLDLSKYDIVSDMNLSGIEVMPIDVLRRLKKNTEPVAKEPPETSDPVFNQRLQSLDTITTKREKQEALREALDYANTQLIEMMDREEIGIEPNHVLAYGWLEQKAFRELQGMVYEDQIDAYKQPWFQSILRFQELTASPVPYDSVAFQAFLDEVSGETEPRKAYAKVFDRTLDHVKKLSERYTDIGKDDRAGALWSGNVTHELIGLLDLRPAETAVGRRHREEQSRPVKERLTGD